MRLTLAVAVALWSHGALAQKTPTTEEYLASLDHAAESCVYFAALNLLIDYKPTIVQQILEKTCKAQLAKLDEESCRLDPGPTGVAKDIEGCIRHRIYSSTTVNAAINLMRMVATKGR